MLPETKPLKLISFKNDKLVSAFFVIAVGAWSQTKRQEYGFDLGKGIHKNIKTELED